MNVELRVPRDVYEHARADLYRPHPIAYERVGLLFGRVGMAAGTTLVLVSRYVPVDDADYLKDATVGAAVAARAMRPALEALMAHGECLFHVHCHAGRGVPRFSQTDLRSLFAWMPSVCAAAPRAVHGGLVLSEDAAAARAWTMGEPQGVRVARITVVGYPMALLSMRRDA